ncbi:hypothetical protein DFH29DRAFT_372659 [Suillus ampliporus]|nr:hypothetical protein DFH29DRAFT_372659 [Suillus ampliporus]
MSGYAVFLAALTGILFLSIIAFVHERQFSIPGRLSLPSLKRLSHQALASLIESEATPGMHVIPRPVFTTTSGHLSNLNGFCASVIPASMVVSDT